jgi:hypothetical protein
MYESLKATCKSRTGVRLRTFLMVRKNYFARAATVACRKLPGGASIRSSIMADGPHYTASTQTAQKEPLQAVTSLLLVT